MLSRYGLDHFQHLGSMTQADMNVPEPAGFHRLNLLACISILALPGSEQVRFKDREFKPQPVPRDTVRPVLIEHPYPAGEPLVNAVSERPTSLTSHTVPEVSIIFHGTKRAGGPYQV